MSAIRALRQLAGPSSRAFVARNSTRSFARAALPAARRVTSAPATRAFSVSARRFGEGASDLSLAQKLSEELKYEVESGAVDPEFLETFKSSGVWQIADVTGNDEVTLTRSFGNENIRMMFSIMDVQAQQENAFEENEQETEEGSENEPSYPIRTSFVITKGNNGALTFDAIVQDGTFAVENVSYYKDSKIGTELTAEADWKRRGLYIGPHFDTLDVSVQEEFEKFLQERGIDESLANFIPEYAEYKEQKEYVQWLKNVKSFIEA